MSKNLKFFTDDASRQTYEQSHEYLEPYVGGVSSSQTSSYNKRNTGKYFIDYTRTEHRLSDFDINNKDVIEVEYLESNGTAYIDTGIKCTSKLKVQFEALVTTDVNKAVCGGISNASGSTYFRHHWTPSQSNFYWIQRSSANTSSVTFNYSTNTWYNVIIDPVNGTASINNTSKTFTKITGLYTTNQNYFIFARKAENGDMQSRPSKFKSFKIWDDGILVRDMIAVRVGNTGYMYDKVSRALFENVGTGNFVIGPDKYDAEIEYLQSTGTQYINTGIKLFENSPTSLEFSVKAFVNTGQSNNSVIFNAMKEIHPYPGIVLRVRSNNIHVAVGNDSNPTNIGTCGSIQNLHYSKNNLTFVHNVPITIFAGLDGNGSPWRFCKLKLYNMNIIKNNNTFLNLIPVRIGNSGYMYDKISGRLFGNSGSGEFTLGPDVV